MNSTPLDAAIQEALLRAQVLHLLADALIYPDAAFAARLSNGYAADLMECLAALGEPGQADWMEPFERFARAIDGLALEDLQHAHRLTFGVASDSPPYETEYGQSHAFRQSHELADITGFYRAFGFDVGGGVRERPDYLGVELEFMYVLARKHAYALAEGLSEAAEVCHDAQRKFLRDHLARWVGVYARKLNDAEAGIYASMAALIAAFADAETQRFGIGREAIGPGDLRPTPIGPSLSCMGGGNDDEFSF